MWYVAEVGYQDIISFKIVPVQSLVYNKAVARRGIVKVIVRNTESSDFKVLSTEYSTDAFERCIRELNPYGVVFGEDNTGSDIYVQDEIFLGGFLIVTVDILSIDFLKYVESVGSFSTNDLKLTAYVLGLEYHVSFWDKDGTIVEIGWTKGKYACTLFQMLCFLKEGWRGDKFYIRQGLNSINGWVTDPGRCVTFTDSHKARAMIAKAVTSGYNPLMKYAQEIAMRKAF